MDTIESFYRDHSRAVFAFLYSLSRDRTLAEDLTQDTFVKATRALAGFRGGDPRAWLFAIARSVFIDHTRRRRPQPTDILEPVPGPGGPDVEERHVIESVLARLPERQRMALLLVDHAGLSYAEMAAVVGTGPDAAKQLLHRARTTFRTLYQEMNS
ncbi:MAG: RNA polymerase sigma factor [Acidimicrobiia bacterium]|nr:RNA polymerase sigma factor [Acidimicrobiia bacterium]